MSVLSHQSLKSLILGEQPMIKIAKESLDELLQPASLDCPLGAVAYRVSSPGIPRKNEPVSGLLSRALFDWPLEKKQDGGYLLEKGCTYIVPLAVGLALSDGFYGEFSPKSTIGRNDVFVRVLMDGHSRFDVTPRGYSGGLWLEIIPLSYPVRIRPGLSMTQMRIKNQEEPVGNEDLELLHSRYGVVRNKKGDPLPNEELSVRQNGIFLHVDLSTPIIGLEARDCPDSVVDLWRREFHDPKRFWSPVFRSEDGTCTLSPGKFYLLRTREYILIPPSHCACMSPYDVASGEFRSHYAGFFDNGFGSEGGTVGVLEVRVRDIPFRISDGQPICRFVFEETNHVPEVLYLGNYTERGPSLAKNFSQRHEVWTESFWRA